jgi:hypothetical protein
VVHASIGALAGDACAYELVLASGLGRVRILVAGSGGESPGHTPTRIPVAHLRALQNVRSPVALVAGGRSRTRGGVGRWDKGKRRRRRSGGSADGSTSRAGGARPR